MVRNEAQSKELNKLLAEGLESIGISQEVGRELGSAIEVLLSRSIISDNATNSGIDDGFNENTVSEAQSVTIESANGVRAIRLVADGSLENATIKDALHSGGISRFDAQREKRLFDGKVETNK